MKSQTKAITGHDQLAQKVLSVSPSSRWGHFILSRVQVASQAQCGNGHNVVRWQLEEYEGFYAGSYLLNLNSLMFQKECPCQNAENGLKRSKTGAKEKSQDSKTMIQAKWMIT